MNEVSVYNCPVSKNIYPSNNVYIGKSKIFSSGRGVFAKVDIKRGELLEKCPFIEIPGGETSNLETSTLITYLFFFGKNKKRAAFALGFGSIYNHSDKPNAFFKIKTKDKVIEFIALKHIKKDSEITFNYRGSGKRKNKKKPLWFE